MTEYDITVIGGGPGGYVAAIKAAQMGAKTALIEKETVGGVCLNWGCIPTKALLKSANVYKELMESELFGIDIPNKSEIKINWPKMQKRKDQVVKKLTTGVKTLLERNGVTIYNGFGTVIDQNTVEVNNEKIKTKNLIIATGSSPNLPPIDGIEEALDSGMLVTNRGVLALENMPKKMVIIGGGVIGVEFATLFATLEVDVTIVEKADNILVNIDQDIRDTMVKLLKKNKVKILGDTSVKRFTKNGVEIEKNGKVEQLEADQVLISIGRHANMKGLENLKLKTTKQGIITNEKMETSIKGVYAIGDVNGIYMLAHVASAEGIVAVENIMGKSYSINYDHVPSCIYGFPEIGFVGLSEHTAREKGYDVKVSTFPLSANGKALADGYTEGFIKIVADQKYGEVLGVHILAPHATDMIAEAVTTMELEGTVFELAKAIHPHPTLSEIVMEAAHGAIDKPIHMIK